MDNKERKIWGRRQSRPIKGERADAMRDIFPRIGIKACDLSQGANLSPTDFFGATERKQTWLELGFGGGEHVIGLLDQNPNINILCAEPFINGVANFVKDLPEQHIQRTRTLMDDGMLLAKSLKDNSVEQIYVLNPDPWHKKRHHKRRIINPENLDEFSRILKPGGKLIMASDVPELAEWMLTHSYSHQAFSWDANTVKDWSDMPKDWIVTRYQIKGAKGAKKMSYLFFTCNK